MSETERLLISLKDYIRKTPEDVKKDFPNQDTIRVLRPRVCYTMEYCPERINLCIDENGVIVNVKSG